jgi:hypothetical protein
VQTPAPTRLYWPGEHTVATGVLVTDPTGHAYPAVQLPVQPAVVRATDDPYSPAGQLVQLAEPCKEYLPAGHAL